MGTKVLLVALAAVSAAAGPIYAIGASEEGARHEQDLYIVDAITGVLTRVAPITLDSHPLDLQSLAFTPGLGLYGVAHGALFEINAGNGDATEVGVLGAGLTALVYGPNGIMYGANGNRLYRVDPATGNAAYIGSGNEGPVEALEFDARGVLYAVSGGNRPNSLYLIDPGTGASTLIGTSGAIGFDQVKGLAFFQGSMYGFTQDGLELSINLSTGAAAVVRNLGVGIDYATADPPATPEPATLGLVGVALAVFAARKRLKKAPRSPALTPPAIPQRSGRAPRSVPFAWARAAR